MNKLNRTYKRYSLDRERMRSAKKEYRAAVRLYNHKTSVKRDQRLAEVLSNNPNKFYRYIVTIESPGPLKLKNYQWIINYISAMLFVMGFMTLCLN